MKNRDGKKGKVQKVYPLSPMQAGMLFHTLEKRSSAYIQQMVVTLHGNVDPATVRKTVQYLAKRHDVLRTVFTFGVTEDPKQAVLKDVEIPFIYSDLRSEVGGLYLISDFLEQDRKKGFDLRKEPSFRVSLFRTAESAWTLLLSFHHMVIDGECDEIILSEFVDVYSALKKRNEPEPWNAPAYERYIGWMGKQPKERALEAWSEYLDGYERSFDLKKRKTDSYSKSVFCLSLDEAFSRRIGKLCRESGVTVASFLQTIWGIILQRYQNGTDSVFGFVVPGRPVEIDGIYRTIGLFINTLPVRVRREGNESFFQLVKSVQNSFMDVSRYFYLPLAEIQSRSEMKNRLVDHIMVFQNGSPEELISKVNDFEKSRFVIETMNVLEETNYDLNIVVSQEGDTDIEFQYNENAFDHEFIARTADRLKGMLMQVVEDPDLPVSKITAALPSEEEQVLSIFNNTDSPYRNDVALARLFEEQVEKTPERTAIIMGEKKISYLKLNSMANGIARTLINCGVKPGAMVAIKVDRSPELIAGIWGILKAGGAYVPIDPDYPPARQEYMLLESGAGVILVAGKDRFPGFEGRMVRIDKPEEEEKNPEVENSSQNPSYMIFTSGSTGNPKGVVVRQHSVVNLITAQKRKFSINPEDRILQFSSVCFDASVEQIFMANTSGAALVLLERKTMLDPALFSDYVRDTEVTHIHAVPLFLKSQKIEKPNKIKRIIAGGDIVDPDLVKMYAADYKFYNEYGPTETTCTSIDALISVSDDGQSDITIGRPLDNTKVYIVDRDMNLLPAGIPGELMIGGAGVGIGYHKRRELTESKFIDDPFIPGQKMYRTGDLAAWRSDGRIDFFGRVDFQVKIRGFRIETAEIEKALTGKQGIGRTVVTARDRSGGERYLCAYIVAPGKVDTELLKAELEKQMPDYMVPAAFVQLDRLPLNSSGKLDRSALPEPDFSSGKSYRVPEDEVAKKLCTMWSEILKRGADTIGLDDSFFDMGGHSLSAISFLSRVKKQFGCSLGVTEFFNMRSLEEVASAIRKLQGGERERIVRQPEMEFYPLSSPQKRIYIMNMMDKKSVVYNIPGAVRIGGKIEINKLQEAFNSLIRRHEILRTSFHNVDGTPMQKIHSSSDFKMEILRGDNFNLNDFVKPFDLSVPVLFRAVLIDEDSESTVLFIDSHHIVTDGISRNIMLRELFSLYEGVELPDLTIQYRDYAYWQNSRLEGKEIERQKQYWTELFKDEVEPLELPMDFSRPKENGFEGAVLDFSLDPSVSSELKKRAEEMDLSLFMYLFAAYNVLLARHSGKEEIVVGVPGSGRKSAETEPLLGMFVSTLAMLNRPGLDLTFEKFAKEVKKGVLEAFDNEDFQFEDLVEALNIKRIPGRNPLFDTLFSFEQFGDESLSVGGMNVTTVKFDYTFSKFDISFYGHESGGKISFRIEYSTALFAESTVRHMADSFSSLLENLVEGVNEKIGEIPMLNSEELDLLTKEFNRTEIPLPEDQSIVDLFLQSVKRFSDRTALRDGKRQLSYRELDRLSNSLASQLADRGLKRGDRAAIFMERSIEMVVSIFAVLKAGAAYLPISVDFPKERVDYLIDDGSVSLVLTDGRRDFESDREFEIPDIGRIGNSSQFNIQPGPSDTAYVIYTSGSTGMPKGVEVSHSSVVNLTLALDRRYPLEEEDRYLFKTPFTFDVSVSELFGWFHRGGSLFVMRDGGEKSPSEISEVLDSNGITHMNFVPSMLNLFLDYVRKNRREDFPSLRYVFSAGEALKPETIHLFRKTLPSTALHDLYGPTEATVYATYFDTSEWDEKRRNPIGKPLDNYRIYVVDSFGKIQPLGVPGELWISGAGVAKGYLNRAELSAERFIDDPFRDGFKVYRTGDLARFRDDGMVEYLGRIDSQVKVGGVRIEPGEIENRLMSLGGIEEAVVKAVGEGTGKYLCGWVVSESSIEVSKIRELLAEKLPSYMIPSTYVFLDGMPRNKSGKIDRKALKNPERSLSGEYVAPQNETEKRVVNIFASILGTDKSSVSVTQSFFDLGGNSLKAIGLVSALQEEFGVKISLSSIFSSESVCTLSHEIENAGKAIYRKIEPVEKTGFYELSFNQKRLWILDRLEDGRAFNMPEIVTIDHRAEESAMENALSFMMERHESLRTGFTERDGIPFQFVEDQVELPLQVVDVSQSNEELALLQFHLDEVNSHRFDLEKPPLFRAKLIHRSEENSLLALNTHHIISDGWSMEIFRRELMDLYETLREGKEPDLEPVKVSYKDFAAWHNRMIAESAMEPHRKYWKEKIENLPSFNIAGDFESGRNRNEGALFTFFVESEIRDGLKKLAENSNTSLFMVMFAAMNMTLSRLGGSKDVVTAVVSAGRGDRALYPVIGFFVNTVIVHNRVDVDTPFAELLERVKKETLRAFEYQDYPVELVLQDMGKRFPDIPLFFNMLNVEGSGIGKGAEKAGHLSKVQDVKFDLEPYVTETENGIWVECAYRKHLFMPERVEFMMNSYLETLALIAGNPNVAAGDFRKKGRRKINL